MLAGAPYALAYAMAAGPGGGPSAGKPPEPASHEAAARALCEQRAAASARLVLSLLPARQRWRLVADYVDRGGGHAATEEAEAETFLPYLARRVANPSHTLTVCQMLMARKRARAGVAGFGRPGRVRPSGVIVRGTHSSLVWFHADPSAVMAALRGGGLPPLGPPVQAMLFAPGLPRLFRTASAEEADLWAELPVEAARPALIERLLIEGVVRYRD